MNTVKHYNGYCEFSNEVSLSDLMIFANGLKQDKSYLSISVRKGENNSLKLSFEYGNKKTGKESFRTHIENLRESLKTHFGGKFIGWDISSLYYKV